jgi:hypothetical protein
MIGFEKLALVSGAKDGFVGIRKHSKEHEIYADKFVYKPPGFADGNDFAFYLPNGFEGFPKPDPDDEEVQTFAYNSIRNFFFSMYRAFSKFERDNANTGRLNKQTVDKQEYEDQTIKSPGGVSMSNIQGDECILYSKLNSIEKIFHAYSDLAINSLERKMRRTDELDYSRIHHYLDRATYLNDDVIMVDEMNLPKFSLHVESTDLILLYAFILDEVLIQLQEDIQDSPFVEVKVADLILSRRQHIRELSETFREKFLSSSQSIFDAVTHQQTLTVLRESLETIDQITPYKDTDYWQLYESIETFLYGQLHAESEEGDYWGIRGFSLLWEDICHCYYFRTQFEDIRYADCDLPMPSRGANSKRTGEATELDRTRIGLQKVGRRRETTNESENTRTDAGYYWVYSVDVYPSPSITIRTGENANDAGASMKIEPRSFLDLLTLRFDRNYGTLIPENNSPATKRLHKSYDKGRWLTRNLHPDLVTAAEDGSISIIDYKDVPISFFEKGNKGEKFVSDVRKSLVYEFALQQTFKIKENVFLIPFHPSKEADPITRVNGLDQPDHNPEDLNGIIVYKGNFNLFLREYLNESILTASALI